MISVARLLSSPPRMARIVLSAAVALAAGCASSGTPSDVADGGSDSPIGTTPPPSNACDGDETSCIRGSLTTKVFTNPYLFARVYLFSVFPTGAAKPVGVTATSDGGNEVAADGTFAFSHVDPGAHYYLRALARFDASDPTSTVEAIVGPVSVPSASSITITMRPAALNVLQGRAAGGVGAATLTWAMAQFYDPGNGHELTDAIVSFIAGPDSWSLPYVMTPTGKHAYFIALPANTPGGTDFSFRSTHTSTGALNWSLKGELPNFDGALQSPQTTTPLPIHSPINVTWTAVSSATYSLMQLFLFEGGQYLLKYQSPSPLPPDVTTDTVPAADFDVAGSYLLNVVFARTTCPPEADGCVYNTSTASATINGN